MAIGSPHDRVLLGRYSPARLVNDAWAEARFEEFGGSDGDGGLPVASRPRPRVDGFAVKIEEWVDRSRGKIRADVEHQRLVAMGYMGSERTTRRAVAG